MMTKKDFKQFADAYSEIKEEKVRELILEKTIPIFKSNNYRFDENRFREWIKRRVEGLSTKGLG